MITIRSMHWSMEMVLDGMDKKAHETKREDLISLVKY